MSGWPTFKLSDVALIGAGNAAPQDPKLFEDGTVPFIRTSDVGRIHFGQISSSEDLLNNEGSRNLRIWPENTILFPKSGASTFLNHRVITGIKACVASHLATIVVERDKILPKFLLYFLHTIRAQDLIQDQNYPSLRLPEIGSINIPLPPLAEQQRIVAILDEAFEGIATATENAKRNVKNARELTRRLVDWHLDGIGDLQSPTPMNELRDMERVITYGVIKLGEHVDGGVPCLRTSNVKWLDVDVYGVKSISKELSESYRRTILRGGEVLVNVRGTLGGVHAVDASMIGWNISREVAMVPADTNKVIPEFLAYWVARTKSQQWLTGVKTGATYTGINIEDLRTLPVYCPDLGTQKELIDRLSSTLSNSRKLDKHYQRRLSELEKLKSSLLQKAFSGQLNTARASAA